MDAINCIKTRRSIRKFKPESVSKDILMDVINTAKWSPSYKNSQPWEAIVLSGSKKEALSEMLTGLIEKGIKPCPDIPEPETWPQAEGSRIADLYKKRSEATGIDLNAPEVIKKAKIINFNFYGAPHAIYLFQDSSLTPWSLFDLGLFAQSLMLAAHAKGIGSVPQAFAVDYAQDIKKFLNIPETKRLVLGISVGYPDLESPANAFRTDRVETEEIVKWIE
jgi:nitroreductase